VNRTTPDSGMFKRHGGRWRGGKRPTRPGTGREREDAEREAECGCRAGADGVGAGACGSASCGMDAVAGAQGDRRRGRLMKSWQFGVGFRSTRLGVGGGVARACSTRYSGETRQAAPYIHRGSSGPGWCPGCPRLRHQWLTAGAGRTPLSEQGPGPPFSGARVKLCPFKPAPTGELNNSEGGPARLGSHLVGDCDGDQAGGCERRPRTSSAMRAGA